MSMYVCVSVCGCMCECECVWVYVCVGGRVGVPGSSVQSNEVNRTVSVLDTHTTSHTCNTTREHTTLYNYIIIIIDNILSSQNSVDELH